MLTLIITLFIISIIQFTIYLILEFTNMRRNNKQKLNDEHDKLNSISSRDICGSREDSRQSDKTE